MKKEVYRRINITLPEETIAVLDSVAEKGNRSSFIASAIQERAERMKKKNLRELLKEGAIAHRERDLALAEEWFHLEEELWQE